MNSYAKKVVIGIHTHLSWTETRNKWSEIHSQTRVKSPLQQFCVEAKFTTSQGFPSFKMSIKLRSHDDQNSNIVTVGENICKCDEENEFHVIELA